MYDNNFIHPTAIIYPGVTMGTGNTVGPYCIIGAPAEWRGREKDCQGVIIGNNNNLTGLVTVDSGADGPTIIGDGCYLMKGSHLGHDVVLGNNVTISCGARIGGHSILEDGVNVGLNATIIQRKKVPQGVMIGMGAIITKKICLEPFKVYAGNPARQLGENTKHPNYLIYMKQFPGE